MSELLFDVPIQKSPRLVWMEMHKVKLHDHGEPFLDEVKGDCERWLCYSESHAANGEGKTEDEAIADFARCAGIRLWNEI